MLIDELRERLAAVNRAILSRRPAQQLLTRRCDLETLIPGQVQQGPVGAYYLVRRTVASYCAPPLDGLVREHPQVASRLRRVHHELESFASAFPKRTLFLDLETCGFSGAPLFLIGLLRQTNGELVVEQLLARDYTEEPAILTRLWELLPGHDVLVTFNGKSFDWPFVLDRSTVHRLPAAAAAPGWRAGKSGSQLHEADFRSLRDFGSLPRGVHCDLLFHARRHWKESLPLPNCRLQTLESALFRRYRSGDIPGSAIPDAYHAYVRNRDARQLRQILHHNALDLLTLAQLALTLVRQLAGWSVDPLNC